MAFGIIITSSASPICCIPTPLPIKYLHTNKTTTSFYHYAQKHKNQIPQSLISSLSAERNKVKMSHEGHRNMSDDMPGMDSDMSDMGSGDLRNTTRTSMQKSFYWGKRAIILFPDWPGDQDLGMFLLAIAFVFILATAAEVLTVSPTTRVGAGPTKAGAVQAGLYAFRIGIAYLVMLSVMSFNVGIFAAAVGGHALGYFLVKARAQALLNNRADPKI